jgi:hypothetical protein
MRPRGPWRWLLPVLALGVVVAVSAAAPSGVLPPPATVAPGSTPPADPHEHLRSILERPLYQRWQLRQEAAAPTSWGFAQALRERADRIMQWLLAHGFRRQPSHTGSGFPGAPVLGMGLKTFFWVLAWLAIGLFVLALIVLIVRLVRSRDAAPKSDAVLSREQVAEALAGGDALALGGDQWMQEAGRLAGEKNFRAMYRALYLALLSGLHAQGKIDFNRHCTNWTYVRRYRGGSDERAVFSSLTELFDNVWYGLHAPGGADFGDLRRQVQSLIQTGAAPG